ncbi:MULTISPECIES: DUF1161 domain-containing protein [Pseudomonas]|uniref:DUF1161 domain-containing protein n=1 Tax=Pseudomonas mosselii TaxID=78327 RepID=A0A5R8YKX9_9PSED|nr:DUF1161 domain-containing protein [Pseudomonas mosselii]TLP53685.1 DUF1161 domain-containing protein [Pseudomonas mosselii]
MKKLIVAMGLMALAGGALAAGKPCEELKAEIAAKLDAKGVTGYSLKIVNKGEVAKGEVAKGEVAGKVVGTCEAGTKEIVYKRS